jgi:hypothetical protein
MKEMSYKEKIQILQPLLHEIVGDIKKELKADHLRKDLSFNQKYFAKKVLDKITISELVEGYSRAVGGGNEEAGEWIASRWMLKHADVYQFFVERLTAINPDFDQIEKLEETEARSLMSQAVDAFGSKVTYIFSVFNSVVFPDYIYEELKTKIVSAPGPILALDSENPEELKKQYEESIAKVVSKYEKKLQGLERKYVQDVEGYKKQIASLQRQLK